MSKFKLSLFLLLITLVVSACSPNNAPAPAPTAGAQATPTLAAQPPATPTPAPTPLPVRNKVVLVAPPEESPEMVEALRAGLAELATAAQLTLETRSSLDVSNIPLDFKVVVLLKPASTLAELLAAAPQTHWVILGNEKMEASANLSVIRQREDLRTFIGGYLTTLVASDWRSVGLLPDARAQEAFINGGRYWCGRCIPMYPPVVSFPLAAVGPIGAAPATWQSVLAPLQKSVITAVYLSPAAYSPDLAKSLAALKLTLVGPQTPPAEARSRWAATLRFDPLPALRKLWPDLLAGKSGQIVDAGLTWIEVNPDIFTPGKQRLAQETLQALLDGTIEIFAIPAQ